MDNKKGNSPSIPSFSEFLKLWQNQSLNEEIKDFSKHINSNPLLENLLNTGPSFLYMLNYKTMRYEYLSANYKNIVGYKLDDIKDAGPQFFYNFLHPDDLQELHNHTFKKILDFYYNTPIQERKKVRCSYDYRMRREDGQYIRLLQQTVVVDIDKKGNPLLDLGIISDITQYKKETKINLTLSLYDEKVGFMSVPQESDFVFRISERELQILNLLTQGFSSKKIAEKLNISINTVRNHRQNLLEKTQTKNIAELISFAMSKSLI